MKFIFVNFLILNIFFASAHATYNPGEYGEKDFDLYYGAMDIDYSFDESLSSVVFKETQIYNDYPNYLIEPKLIDFQTFFSKELAASLSCPSSEMTRMYDYLRFVNRLIAMSYLFEANQNYLETSAKLGNNKTCKIDWEKELESCQPKTSDMKLFIKSAKHILKEVKEPMIPVTHSIKKFQSSWINKFHMKDFQDPTHYRLNTYCSGKNCSEYMNYEKALELLQASCEEDKTLFGRICSEEDSLYAEL